MKTSSPLRIAVVGGALFGLRQPFAGGMESHTFDLVHGLRRRGHVVEVYAGPGSESSMDVISMWDGAAPTSATVRRDVSSCPEQVVGEHFALQRTMLALTRRQDVDVVHLNGVHHLPVAMRPLLDCAVTATLHCPPVPWLEHAHRELLRDDHTLDIVAVSRQLAHSWQQALGIPVAVIENAVELAVWRPGHGGGGYAAWFGRLVPEKAPHLAIEAARLAGLPIVLAGPAHDLAYFAAEVEPLLGRGATWVGPLPRPRLAELVGRAEVTIVSSMWDEPFGLVAAESLACATPVATTGRGALRDVVGADVGAHGSTEVHDLADAIVVARTRSRRLCSRPGRRALRHRADDRSLRADASRRGRSGHRVLGDGGMTITSTAGCNTCRLRRLWAIPHWRPVARLDDRVRW